MRPPGTENIPCRLRCGVLRATLCAMDDAPVPAAVSMYERTVTAHAAYYSALVGKHGPQLKGAGKPDGGKAQLFALRWLSLELQNILEALDTALSRGKMDWIRRVAERL